MVLRPSDTIPKIEDGILYSIQSLTYTSIM